MWRIALVAFLLAGPLAAQKKELSTKRDPFAGTYSNERVELSLRRAQGKRYQGLVFFNGRTYPVTARADRDVLNGTFTDGGRSFSFTAKMDGDRLSFSTGGVIYALRQQALVNPLAAAAHTAQPLQPKLHRHASGAVFLVPEGWTVRDAAASAVLVPPPAASGVRTPEELYVIASHDGFAGTDDPRLIGQLRQDLAGTGLHFDRAGDKERFSMEGRVVTVLTWELKSPESGLPMMIRIFLVESGDHTQTLAAIAPRDRVLGWDPQLRQIVASLKYEMGQAAAPGPVALWTQRLSGTALTQTDASAGVMSKKVLRLVADGSFRYTGSGAIDSPPGSRQETVEQSATGRWRIVTGGGQALLELTFADGSQNVLRLSIENNETFLDGVRAVVSPLESQH